MHVLCKSYKLHAIHIFVSNKHVSYRANRLFDIIEDDPGHHNVHSPNYDQYAQFVHTPNKDICYHQQAEMCSVS